MSHVEFIKAGANDFEELVDLINLVFSNAVPTNFETLLPVQYAERNFMSGTNYAVRENGRIVASVGSYPVDYRVCGNDLRIAGITAVAVHARKRSKGYMKKLMDMALDDMRKDKIDFSFLYGLRQRYEYFGFTPCGTRFEFHFDKHNFQHYFGKDIGTGITLKEVEAGDTELFNKVKEIYNAESVNVVRPCERFADVMSTWECKTVAVYKDDRFIGYLSAERNNESICEFFIDDVSLAGDVLYTFSEQFKRNHFSVSVFPYEYAMHSFLSKFADSVSVNKDGNFYVIDYLNTVESFLKLKCEYTKIPDGDVTLNIKNVGNLTIGISNNIPSVKFTDEKPDIDLTAIEASQLLFSQYSAFALDSLEGNPFARCLFPIPLFVRRLDRS